MFTSLEINILILFVWKELVEKAKTL